MKNNTHLTSSNRTFMELKLLIKISCNVGTSSNRTFMELK